MSNRWEGIEEFVAVAAKESFVQGAASLGISTSHASRAVARLENRLQTQLFFRTTRKVTLTDAGKTLAEQCRRIIQERDDALAAVSGAGELHGEMRITCSLSIGERFVAPIVRRFAEANPQLSVTLDLTNRVVDLVGEGYDLAVRTGQLPDSTLTRVWVASRSLHLCASPAYLERAGRPKRVSDLSRHNCLIGSSSLWHFRAGSKEQQFRPHGRWRCNSGVAVADAAVAGMGICQLPEFYVGPYLRSGELEPLLVELRPEDEPIWAVYPQRRHLQPKVRNLVDRLKTEFPTVYDEPRG